MTSSHELAREQRLEVFIEELSGFAGEAETLLTEIDRSDEFAPARFESCFEGFSKQMIAIRGTSDQLGFPHISRIAGLGEEIAIKVSATFPKRNQLKRYLSSLWDALTTVRFMVRHPATGSTEEQEILVHRLQTILAQLGGPRAMVDEEEIERMLRARNPSS